MIIIEQTKTSVSHYFNISSYKQKYKKYGIGQLVS